MVLLTTDDLRNIFTKEDFSNTKTYSDYEITTIKKGNLVTYSIKYHNPTDAFEKYVKSLDDDIFVKACEMYEKLTGQSLNNLDKLIKSNKLTDNDIKSFKNVVDEVVLDDINHKLDKYNLFNYFREIFNNLEK